MLCDLLTHVGNQFAAESQHGHGLGLYLGLAHDRGPDRVRDRDHLFLRDGKEPE